jgi:hypothetical protein
MSRWRRQLVRRRNLRRRRARASLMDGRGHLLTVSVGAGGPGGATAWVDGERIDARGLISCPEAGTACTNIRVLDLDSFLAGVRGRR